MIHQKPPLGVMPRYLWDEFIPEPTLPQLVERHIEVREALKRYREAGIDSDSARKAMNEWRRELGLVARFA